MVTTKHQWRIQTRRLGGSQIGGRQKCLHLLKYCCDRKSRAVCAQSFASWQQAAIEIMLAISLTIACSRYICNGVILNAHPVRGESHSQHNTTEEVATTSPRFYIKPRRSHVPCVKAELGKTSTSWSQHHFVDVSLIYVMMLFFTHILFMVMCHQRC